MDDILVTIKKDRGIMEMLRGESAICFTISDAEEYMRKEVPRVRVSATFMGKEIPDAAFAKTIGCLIVSLIKHRRHGEDAWIAMDINDVIHALEICERAFNGGKTIAEDPEAVEEAMRNDEVSQLIRRAFGRGRDHGGQ